MVSVYDEVDANAWFHSSDYNEPTPAETILLFNNHVLNHLESRGYKLRVPTSKFRKNMCTAMVMIALANAKGKQVSNPTSVLPLPKNWNDAAEELWSDYMMTFVLSNDFWDSVFKTVPCYLWEEAVPDWRITLRFFVLHYVERDVATLSEAGVMFEDSEGELVEAADYVESEQEYD